jgi:hypothetical protein
MICGDASFKHTVVVPEIVAVGKGFIVIVAILLTLIHGAVPVNV